MKRFLKKLEALSFSERSIPYLLLFIAVLTYGLFFWQRGFYWDEEPWTWIYYRLGPAILTKTFSTSRPFWGMIYQLTLPIIGPVPWRWQVLMVIMRWLTAVLGLGRVAAGLAKESSSRIMDEFVIFGISRIGSELCRFDVHAFLHCSELFSPFALSFHSRHSHPFSTFTVYHCRGGFGSRQFADDGIFLFP